MENVNNNINSNAVQSTSTLGSISDVSSLQMMFAALQMDLARENRDSATNRINLIKENQAMSKKASEAMNELRSLGIDTQKYNVPTTDAELQKQIKTCNDSVKMYEDILGKIEAGTLKPYIDQYKNPCYDLPTDQFKAMEKMCRAAGKDNFTDMLRGDDNKHMLYELKGGLAEIQKYQKILHAVQTVRDSGLSLDFLKNGFNKDSINAMITSLQNITETNGSEVQTSMIFVQDHIGKYNSYTQGANTAIANANQVNTAIAKGQ